MADSYLFDGQSPNEHVASCIDCGAAIALLDHPETVAEPPGGAPLEPLAEPPPRLREAVLSAARRRRNPAAVGVATVAVPYAELVAVMDDVLAELSPVQWAAPVPKHGTVRSLVEHLTANDATVARFMGVPATVTRVSAGVSGGNGTAPGAPAGTRTGPDARAGNGTVSGARAGTGTGPDLSAGTGAGQGVAVPEHRRWREQAGLLLSRVAAGSEVLLGVEVALAGARPARAPLRQAMIQRTFETWTHTDDIRAATGRAKAEPRPEHVHMIAEFGLALLPRALRGPRRDVSATIVLTGPGGGTWTIPLSPASDHVAVLISADAADFCRLLGNRWPPGAFPYAAEGDPVLARDLIAAAATLGCD
jgi:uncharacterized protein (TIGR03083 family)